MSTTTTPIEAGPFSEVMERVKTWPPRMRIALARGILDSLDVSTMESAPGERPIERPIGMSAPDTPGRSPRGLSADEVTGLLKTDRPAPDDETIKRWIDEHRVEKYG